MEVRIERNMKNNIPQLVSNCLEAKKWLIMCYVESAEGVLVVVSRGRGIKLKTMEK